MYAGLSGPVAMVVALTLLPGIPMTPRLADPRVGYFTSSFVRVGPGPVFRGAGDENATRPGWDCRETPCVPESSPYHATPRRMLTTAPDYFDDWDKTVHIIHRRRLDTSRRITFYIGT